MVAVKLMAIVYTKQDKFVLQPPGVGIVVPGKELVSSCVFHFMFYNTPFFIMRDFSGDIFKCWRFSWITS